MQHESPRLSAQNATREVIMKRIVPIVLVTLAASIGMFAQGRRGAPPPPPTPLEARASQTDVDKARALAGYNFGMRIDLAQELLSEADE